MDFRTGAEVHRRAAVAGGADAGVLDAFVTAVATGDPRAIRTGPGESLASHLVAFAAERARHCGTVVGVPTG
ncbi:hypothetical protein [Amycolatopsis methanolica]|uniref:hypothetical protein n=1 Tax=Amycolatopsis methanolica TaxID=1814 RepID=UPI001ADFEAB9|nr:hypothetical protein [Amycolatopsis methanolica]